MTSKSTRKATAEDLTALDSIVERNAVLVKFADDAMATGHSLHERIGVIADNTWVSRLHQQVDGHMSRYRKLTNSTQERRDQALEEHRAIVAAISARNANQASRRARDHVLAARDQAIRVLSLGDFMSG